MIRALYPSHLSQAALVLSLTLFTSAQAEVEVKLHDGTRLRGELISIDSADSLILSSETFGTEFSIPSERVHSVLDLDPVAAEAARQSVRLELDEGSVISGTLQPGPALNFIASNGTPVQIPLESVLLLTHHPDELTGPLSPDDWQHNSSSLSAGAAPLVEDGAHIWRDDIPSRGQFVVSWRSRGELDGLNITLQESETQRTILSLVSHGRDLHLSEGFNSEQRSNPLAIQHDPQQPDRGGYYRVRFSWDLNLNQAGLDLGDGLIIPLSVAPKAEPSSFELTLDLSASSLGSPVIIDSIRLIDASTEPSLVNDFDPPEYAGVRLADGSFFPAASLRAIESTSADAQAGNNALLSLPDGTDLPVSTRLLRHWRSDVPKNSEPETNWIIRLDDGSRLLVNEFHSDETGLHLTHPRLGQLNYPLTSLATAESRP